MFNRGDNDYSSRSYLTSTPTQTLTPMLLNQSEIDDFHINGFAVSKQPLLNDEEVETLRDALQGVIDGRSAAQPLLNRNMLGGGQYDTNAKEDAGKEVRQIVNICEASPVFDALIRRSELTKTVVRLCGNPPILRLWHDQIQYKPPINGGATRWHQDFLAWPVIEPADLVSAWVALDDADVENGCMWMVPGSHRWGGMKIATDMADFRVIYEEDLIPEGVEVRQVPMPVKKGHVAFHHCMTWHGSPPNPSPRPRRAFAIHYMPGHTIFAPRGRSHPATKDVTIAPGEILEGPQFPVVYQNDRALEIFRKRYQPAVAV